MFKRIQHIIVLLLMLVSFTQAIAQIAMPDTVCIGTTRTYKVNDASVPSTYTWKINNVTQSSTKNEITVTWNTPGTFELTVLERSANGCEGDIRSGLVYVMPLPTANAGPDIVVCFGTPVRLNGSGGGLYQWTAPPNALSNTAIANPVVTMPFAGTHQFILTVTSVYGCKSLKSDTVSVTILPPVKLFAGNDTAITINQSLQLNAIDVNNSGFTNYLWSPPFRLSNPSIKNPVASYNTVSGTNGFTYTVTATTVNGCTAKDDITIKVFSKPEIYVPSAFTPNGDKLNDFALAIPVGIKEFKYFSIYNRWGELVFTTTDPSKGWDGTFKGIHQDPVMFVWKAEGVDYTGNTIFRKGFVMLIR